MGCPTPDIIWFKDNLPLTALGKDHHFSVDTKTPQIGNRTSDLEIKAEIDNFLKFVRSTVTIKINDQF